MKGLIGEGSSEKILLNSYYYGFDADVRFEGAPASSLLICSLSLEYISLEVTCYLIFSVRAMAEFMRA